MYVHIALYKWKNGTGASDVADALSTVRSLQELVPGVTAIHVGENYSKWNEGYTHGIVVLGRSQGAIDAYRVHPVHEEVAAKIEAMEESGVGVDFHDAP